MANIDRIDEEHMSDEPFRVNIMAWLNELHEDMTDVLFLGIVQKLREIF
jgi:hypothetical protein